jgi:hypothetical protein
VAAEAAAASSCAPGTQVHQPTTQTAGKQAADRRADKCGKPAASLASQVLQQRRLRAAGWQNVLLAIDERDRLAGRLQLGRQRRARRHGCVRD